ncbi:JmjC domain-containing protein [Ralstonia pseudosolanacearum]|uniref:JmjC domain-containing protein n=1 Tax=Ralstonia pseudosolanacearum TaxID=1310165 RepID=UPI0018D1B143|nr:cupin domain-containing protein [Ralstonia pseudosolanacearum]
MKVHNICNTLLADADFRSHYGSRTFWIRNLGGGELQKIFCWEDLNACLSFNRITNDRFRMSTEHEHDGVNRRAFRAVRDRFGRNTDYLVIHELHKLMREGVTAVLEAVNELSPSVGELTETLAGTLGAQSTANAYISFGSTSGFGPHNDDHDVVVLQLHGRKKWQFFRKKGLGEKATVEHLTSVTKTDRGEEIVVCAGDVMYVPKGTWHDVVALDEESLHLTISLVYPTLADFIAWGLSQSQYGVPFKDLRPDTADHQDALAACNDFFARLLHVDNLNVYLSTVYASKMGSRPKADFPRLHSVSPDDVFRRTAREIIPSMSGGQNERIDAFALGRVHSLTPVEFHLLEEMPHVGSVSGRELAMRRGNWDALAPAIGKLLDLGLVGKVQASV